MNERDGRNEQSVFDRKIAVDQMQATVRLVELVKLGLEAAEKQTDLDSSRRLAEMEAHAADTAKWTQRIFVLILILGIALPVTIAFINRMLLWFQELQLRATTDVNASTTLMAASLIAVLVGIVVFLAIATVATKLWHR